MQIPLWVFAITCMLEFLHLWHPPILEEFKATFVGRLLIGTTFSWENFLLWSKLFLGLFLAATIKSKRS